MNNQQELQAVNLLQQFKGDNYVFGLGCFDHLGEFTASLGRRAVIVSSGMGKQWGQDLQDSACRSLAAAGVEVQAMLPGARPNSPRQDVDSLAEALRQYRPLVVLAMGGGSVIDAAKAAIVMADLGDLFLPLGFKAQPGLWAGNPVPKGDIEAYFGVGKVTEMLRSSGRSLTPLLAVQLAASSAAHLTKYSNITDLSTSQKKLIIDDAVTPTKALFDYATTASMSAEFTADGALDGMSHCLEVFYGLKGSELAKVRPVSLTGIELIVQHIEAACRDGQDLQARKALCLGTDLGGYAIMIGGTNGAHLTSFSLVDILPHGRACALMNPYYTVFFAPAIEPQLRDIAAIFRAAGYLKIQTDSMHGRDLGLAVAEGMITLGRAINFPTRLADVPQFSTEHIKRVFTAAKNPQLASKLQNMPVPMSAENVDEYIGPILEAARDGDFSRIRNMPA